MTLLSRQEGLGRHARECCGVEPLVLGRAWRLLADDPVPEVRRVFPEARAGEAQAAGWHRSFAGAWGRDAEA